MRFVDNKQKAFHDVSLKFADVLKDYEGYDFITLLTGHPQKGVGYSIASYDSELALFVNLKAILESLETHGHITESTSNRIQSAILTDALDSAGSDVSKVPEFFRELIEDDGIALGIAQQAVHEKLNEEFERFVSGEISKGEFADIAEVLGGKLSFTTTLLGQVDLMGGSNDN